MTSPRVKIKIETNAETASKSTGRQVIEAVCREPKLVPQRLGYGETYDADWSGVDDFVENHWAQESWIRDPYSHAKYEFLTGPEWLRRSRPASSGKVVHKHTTTRGDALAGRLSFDSKWDVSINFEHLFQEWLVAFPARIGMLHVFTGPELRKHQSEAESWFQTGSFGGPMKPGLPNIGWAMVYGGEYRAEVDADAIQAAGFPIEDFGQTWLVRVTDRLADVVDDFAEFSRRRAELKALFQPGLFWMSDEPEGQQ